MRKVFYSWQSDLPGKTNRNLILDALERACKRVGADAEVEPVVDRDTLNVPGSPDITEIVLGKIEDADAFVADVSIINFEQSPSCRPTPNPNVLVELGYAIRRLGHDRIVLVINTYFGKLELLPFDLRQLRVLAYEASPDDEARTPAKKELAMGLEDAVRAIAAVVKPDAASKRICALTMNIAGQAAGLLQDMIKAAGMTFQPETITKDELHEVCRNIDPNGQAPLVIDGNPKDGWRYATWLGHMAHWRSRSRQFTEDLRFFDKFLDREHIGMVAEVEECSYFAQLDRLAAVRLGNSDLTYLDSSLWEYVEATRRLKGYAMRHLRR